MKELHYNQFWNLVDRIDEFLYTGLNCEKYRILLGSENYDSGNYHVTKKLYKQNPTSGIILIIFQKYLQTNRRLKVRMESESVETVLHQSMSIRTLCRFALKYKL